MANSERKAQRARVGAAAARVERARQRRLELNADREAKEARVDGAVADVYQAQEKRESAAALIARANVAIGSAIVRILAEGVAIAQVAELTGLTVNQAQRLKGAVHGKNAAAGDQDVDGGGTSNAGVEGATPRARAS